MYDRLYKILLYDFMYQVYSIFYGKCYCNYDDIIKSKIQIDENFIKLNGDFSNICFKIKIVLIQVLGFGLICLFIFNDKYFFKELYFN